MATYVLMTKLSPEIMRDVKHREKIGKKWKEDIALKCPGVKFICHYALLGPYDFLDIYEAPDEKTAIKVSLITQALGAVKAESWTALPYTQFLELAEEIA
jgi:uncharacterized protein with GYD domain